MGQAFISLPLFSKYLSGFFNRYTVVEPCVYIGVLINFMVDFVIYPLLYIYRKEEFFFLFSFDNLDID